MANESDNERGNSVVITVPGQDLAGLLHSDLFLLRLLAAADGGDDDGGGGGGSDASLIGCASGGIGDENEVNVLPREPRLNAHMYVLMCLSPGGDHGLAGGVMATWSAMFVLQEAALLHNGSIVLRISLTLSARQNKATRC